MSLEPATGAPVSLEDLINRMTESDLIKLNRVIIERINWLRHNRTKKALSEFQIGDAVYFEHEGYDITGIVVRINQKTATIATRENRQWRVSPQLLQRYIDA